CAAGFHTGEQHRARAVQPEPTHPREKTTEHHEGSVVPGDRRRHPLRRILAPARTEYSSDGECAQPSYSLNRAGAAGIRKPELRQPTATTYPVRKQGKCTSGKTYCRGESGIQDLE